MTFPAWIQLLGAPFESKTLYFSSQQAPGTWFCKCGVGRISMCRAQCTGFQGDGYIMLGVTEILEEWDWVEQFSAYQFAHWLGISSKSLVLSNDFTTGRHLLAAVAVTDAQHRHPAALLPNYLLERATRVGPPCTLEIIMVLVINIRKCLRCILSLSVLFTLTPASSGTVVIAPHRHTELLRAPVPPTHLLSRTISSSVNSSKWQGSD